MNIRQWLARLPIFPLLIAVSFVMGWYIPAFYDWTGSDQSRPSPLIGQTACGLTFAGMIVCAILPWLPIAHEPPDTNWSLPVRFKLRTMLMSTAAVAVLIAALMKFPMVISGGLFAIVLCYVVWFWKRFCQHRVQTISLFACMSFPFVWIISYEELDRIAPAILWMVAGFPAILPTLIISGMVGHHSEQLMWLAILLTTAEIVIGLWMIRLGPRRTIAYLIFVLLLSTFGSFVFNALMRA